MLQQASVCRDWINATEITLEMNSIQEGQGMDNDL